MGVLLYLEHFYVCYTLLSVKCDFAFLVAWLTAGLHNVRPAKAFLAVRESFLNCKKCCKSSTSNK